MSENCQYSIRLINRLKELDQAKQIDYAQVEKAIYWAKKYHADQKRKSGEPYYTHPLEVAYMVAEYNLKTDVIVAAILHDIVEDTEVTFGMILDNFNERIKQMVDRLTRDRPDGTKWSIKQVLNIAYLADDTEVLLIKIIDRIHNLQTMQVFTKHKAVLFSRETVEEMILAAMYIENQTLVKILYRFSLQELGTFEEQVFSHIKLH
ncbi:MAG: HD domain-containing protein [Rickettsiaceae bacterium]